MKIPCKIEELRVFGSFLITSGSADKETFTAYSPIYGNDCITRLQADLEKVNNIVKQVIAPLLAKFDGVGYNKNDRSVEQPFFGV